MKKHLFLSVILLLGGVSIFAANDKNNYNSVKTKLSYINDYNEQQIYELSQMSLNFSLNQKESLYSSNKISVTTPFLLNTVFGFGLGSYIQGDISGGSITLAGMLSTFTVFSLGYGASLHYGENIYLNCLSIASLTALVGFKIFGMVRVFTYASNYNKKLSKVLNYVAITPKVSNNNDYKLDLSFKIPIT